MTDAHEMLLEAINRKVAAQIEFDRFMAGPEGKKIAAFRALFDRVAAEVNREGVLESFWKIREPEIRQAYSDIDVARAVSAPARVEAGFLKAKIKEAEAGIRAAENEVSWQEKKTKREASRNPRTCLKTTSGDNAQGSFL